LNNTLPTAYQSNHEDGDNMVLRNVGISNLENHELYLHLCENLTPSTKFGVFSPSKRLQP